MSNPSRRTSGFRAAEAGPVLAALRTGARRARLLAFALVLSAQTGCLYRLQAGIFPEYIETIAIIPFENETSRLELTQELHDELLRELPRSLGLRTAGEDQAQAVLRGRILTYEITTPAYRPAGEGDRAEVLQRQVTITIAVELIDVVNNEILWDTQGLVAQGQFLELSETEDIGREIAIRLLQQRITDGAQSNW